MWGVRLGIFWIFRGKWGELSADFAGAVGSFSGFQQALETVFQIAQLRRIILVIDEYPYLAGSHKSISSMLQILIDKHKDTSMLFLMLCGSSMSFMENQVLGYKSPLFGRRTCQFKILPFDFFEILHYYKNFTGVDLATIYGITGGTPLYLSLMNDNLSVEDEIDIMGTDGGTAALFAECKWTNEKVDVCVLDTLVERSQLFHYVQNHYYLFAKTDFTEGCISKAETIPNMHLVSFDEMIKRFS